MKLTQPSFTGGEISPSLYARVDLSRYATSLKTCRNMIVSAYGGVYNRPGFRFVNATKANGPVRLVPFQFNITQTYVVELGDHYARFYANGGQVISGGVPVEIVTPWAAAEIWDLRYTQSADVMYVTHPSYPPQKITRTSATAFSITPYAPLEGPFQPVNPDDASLMASSTVSGNTVLTSNAAGTFSSDMVGMFVYLENNNLSNIKPWTAGEKNVTVGTFRRNAGKTYQCVNVSTGGTYLLTGGNAPQHDVGSQWDGPGDVRNDGTNTYSVGVLWQYVDSGYGIAKITGFTNDTTVNAVITKQMPAGVVGGSGSPAHSWTMTGDGTTITFPIAANVSNYPYDYAVTIAGVGIPSNPDQPPQPIGPIGGGGCVAVDSALPGGMTARDLLGKRIACVDHADLSVEWCEVTQFTIQPEPCWRIESESGAWLIISKCTPVETRERGYCPCGEIEGLSLPVGDDSLHMAWERIVSVTDAGVQDVAKPHAGSHNYLAGGECGRYISTHNVERK